MKATPFILTICLVFAVLCLGGGAAGCAGYRVGAQSLFSKDVETVYVPVFRADNANRQMAERLTEAVVKRIEAKSRYKVIARPTADSTLDGEIISQTARISISNNDNGVRQRSTTFRVKVKWSDRRQRDLRQFDDIDWSETGGTITSSAYMLPEFGHSQATTEQTAINAIADKIVGMMETPW